MATDWWVVVSTGGQYSVISTAVGSPADRALKSGNPQANINGTDWIALANPYPTKAAAEAALPGIRNFEQTGKGPGKPTIPPLPLGPGSGPPVSAAANAGNPLSGLAAIGDFFSRLTELNTWIRVAKVVVGAALVLIGVAHMTGADNAVMNAARRVPLPI